MPPNTPPENKHATPGQGQSAPSASADTSSGWETHIHDKLIMEGPLIFCYVYDEATNWMWVSGVAREAFVEMSEKAKADVKRTDFVRVALGTLISGMADGFHLQSVDTKSLEQDLAGLISAYAGSAETWEKFNHGKRGGHFVVLYYRKAHSKSGSLRPFALTDTNNKILSHTRLKGFINQVLEVDRKNHPEWF